MFYGLIPSFFHTNVSIWTLTYFFTLFYVILVFTAILYLISNLKDFTFNNSFKNSTSFQYITGLDVLKSISIPLIIFYLLFSTWMGASLSLWFGHLIFTSTQVRLSYLILAFFSVLWFGYLSTFYYSSQEIYDYTIVIYSFFLWMLFLFYSNNLFTVIFFIEILSTVISLTIITSVFSSVYFYNNLDFSSHSYFQHSTPFSFLQTSIFFFEYPL